jgi:glutathione S-transferase
VIELYGHPFSSYTWKVLIALYENATPFTFRLLAPDQPDNGAVLAARSPGGKFPLLIDDARAVAEATAIIDYLDAAHPGAVRFVPADPLAAVEVRMLDRLFDNYVMTPVQKVVGDALRRADRRDAYGVEQARSALVRFYDWLEGALAGREWAAGDAFTLADCAAAPALFYADWVEPIGDRATLAAYRRRLLARPSVARCVEEARPYRAYFPLGAPDRD